MNKPSVPGIVPVEMESIRGFGSTKFLEFFATLDESINVIRFPFRDVVVGIKRSTDEIVLLSKGTSSWTNNFYWRVTKLSRADFIRQYNERKSPSAIHRISNIALRYDFHNKEISNQSDAELLFYNTVLGTKAEG